MTTNHNAAAKLWDPEEIAAAVARAPKRIEDLESTLTMQRKIVPTSPGEILLEEFLKPLGLTQRRLADHLGCDVKVINRIVNGRTGVTPEMSLKLGAAFQTSPEFWLNAQRAVDLYRAAEVLEALPKPLLRAT